MIFDTRPKDFIVVSDDLTTANMDPCIVSKTDIRQYVLTKSEKCVLISSRQREVRVNVKGFILIHTLSP